MLLNLINYHCNIYPTCRIINEIPCILFFFHDKFSKSSVWQAISIQTHHIANIQEPQVASGWWIGTVLVRDFVSSNPLLLGIIIHILQTIRCLQKWSSYSKAHSHNGRIRALTQLSQWAVYPSVKWAGMESQGTGFKSWLCQLLNCVNFGTFFFF